MFGKKQHGDLKKSYQKVLDPKKDAVTRLKHLRVLLGSRKPDNYDVNEAKKFFEANYSNIYYIFYDVFVNLESELKRPNKTHREELDGVLFIFEKILILLPELIHKRWQFHSIGRILGKLLHHGNALKLRREGMRLFLIWYQILQENATKHCHQMFASLVPGLGQTTEPETLDDGGKTANSNDAKVSGVEMSAILPPQPGEKTPENITKCLLDSLVLFMVSEITKVEWENKQMQDFSFNFLFNYFKQHYLMKIFPDFSYQRSIYERNLTLPDEEAKFEHSERNQELGEYQEVIIKWLTLYTHSSKKSEANSSAPDDFGREHCDGDSNQPLDQIPGSNVSTLSTSSSQYTEGSSNNMAAEERVTPGYEIVKASLFSTRENINLVHELYRQAFYFSFKHASAMRKVIAVYRDWLQSEDRPVFMQDPPLLAEQTDNNDVTPPPSNEEDELGPVVSIRAGSQLVMQAFITHSANVFLHDPSAIFVNDQVDMCKRVLNIYRHVVMNLHMERQTWEQLLLVLLKITSSVLRDSPPVDRDNSLGGRLASALFQTLIVTWIKANLNVFISTELWDQFLSVLSSLTQWEELIKEWAKTIETLTRLLARNVYNLDVNDLPLDRLSEQKEKRRRAKTCIGSVPDRVRSSTAILNHNDVIMRSPRSPRRQTDRQTVHVPSRDDRGRKSEVSTRVQSYHGALETTLSAAGLMSHDLCERTRSLSGNGDGGGDTSATTGVGSTNLQRSSSDSHIHQYSQSAAAAVIGDFDRPEEEDDDEEDEEDEEEDEIKEEAARRKEADELEDPSFDEHLVDVLGDHPLTEDQDIRSMTESLTSVGGTDSASYASVDSNLHIASSLDTTLVDSIPESAERRPENAEQSRFGDEPDRVEVPRDVLFPLREELSRRDKSDSRSSSPGGDSSGRSSPAQCSLAEERLDLNGGKDSPTPDRESIHIDAVVDDRDVMSDSVHMLESGEECTSVLAGGSVPGWTPDVCVVLWRRMLGALGDINLIQDPAIHARVYEYLCELLETLVKIRENVAVTVDNMSSPNTPELLPPIMFFAPWLFKALSLPDEYKRGKLLACRLLCLMTIRRHDVDVPPDHVAQFFSALHDGLTSQDQDVVNTLLQYCGPYIFSTGPQGASMLIVDLIDAANNALNSPEMTNTPRTEALSILGALVCYPYLYPSLTVIQPRSGHLVNMSSAEVKDHLISSLLKSGKKEPAGLARCIALSSLGIYLYHELKQQSMHSKVSEAISTLTMTLRFNNKLVAQVACDMLYLLCDHIHIILDKLPQIPAKIIQAISATISSGLPSTTDVQMDSTEERLTCSLMFCLLEWTMRVPHQLVMDAEPGQRPLIYTVFKVLNQAVSGCTMNSISRSTLTLSDLAQAEYDLENVKETQSCPTSPWSAQEAPLVPEVNEEPEPPQTNQNGQAVKTAARTVLNHLVNHFGHFPRGGGAARFNSSVQEFHDIPDLMMDELRPEIFDLPNVQFFVLNSSVLISLIELPAWRDVPGGGMTAGLSTGNTITRLVIRDCTGKYCWDGAVLYRRPCTDDTSSDLQDYVTSCLDDEDDVSISDRIADSFSFLKDTQQDELNKLLNYIGTTSKECLLRPGEPLNIPGPPAEGVPAEVERDVCQCVLVQKDDEQRYTEIHSNDYSVVAQEELPMVIEEPVSPFHICRTLLSQLGFLSWEKRATFDLLKKSERLLRELKNIDNRFCRETHKFAVFYVAPGQEDKNSILSNTSGSKAYEDFVSGLGWEVDLETHCGYRGGLPNDKSCGDTTPYYATSTLEVLYHCSSRMPGHTEEDRHKKLRHLGNDEVMIIWSEHYRDYRRGIIPTEFGDVLIVIYPLDSGLFRVHIIQKSEVPYFGPLFDGAIVEESILAGLVRATAINAGRVKRSTMPYYRPFYEERARYLTTIVSQHKQDSMFEDFAEEVFAPVLDPDNALPGTPLHDAPFMLSSCSSLVDGSDTRSDRHSPRSKQGSRDSEPIFQFPTHPPEKVGRRLSFRNVRKLSSRSSAPPGLQPPPTSESSSPESPSKSKR